MHFQTEKKKSKKITKMISVTLDFIFCVYRSIIYTTLLLIRGHTPWQKKEKKKKRNLQRNALMTFKSETPRMLKIVKCFIACTQQPKRCKPSPSRSMHSLLKQRNSHDILQLIRYSLQTPQHTNICTIFWGMTPASEEITITGKLHYWEAMQTDAHSILCVNACA